MFSILPGAAAPASGRHHADGPFRFFDDTDSRTYQDVDFLPDFKTASLNAGGSIGQTADQGREDPLVPTIYINEKYLLSGRHALNNIVMHEYFHFVQFSRCLFKSLTESLEYSGEVSEIISSIRSSGSLFADPVTIKTGRAADRAWTFSLKSLGARKILEIWEEFLLGYARIETEARSAGLLLSSDDQSLRGLRPSHYG